MIAISAAAAWASDAPVALNNRKVDQGKGFARQRFTSLGDIFLSLFYEFNVTHNLITETIQFSVFILFTISNFKIPIKMSHQPIV